MLDGLTTDRLRLVAADATILGADLDGSGELGFALAAAVPRDWPPETWDARAVRWLRDHLTDHPDEVGWWAAYLVTHDEVVIGTAGFKGPPRGGSVEIGYSLVPSAHGLGYATEAVDAAAAAALVRADVDHVVAHTLEDGAASQAVLRRAGFVATGPGDDPGTRRFVRSADPD